MVKHALRHSRSFFCLLLLLVTSGVSSQVAAEPCDPEESKWVPSRYYPEGAVVFHEGQWYESREMHKGLEPGITFDWIGLDSVPDCTNRKQSANQAASKDEQEESQNRKGQKSDKSTRGLTASGMCVRPDPWLFSESYSAGDLVSHGGQLWEALRETRGDMPGMNEPPYWTLVENHCALKEE